MKENLKQRLQRERWVWTALYFLVPYGVILLAILVTIGVPFGFPVVEDAFLPVAVFCTIPAAISMCFSLREDRNTRPVLWDKDFELLVHEICPRCGYDLRATTQPRCPECGTPFRLNSLEETHAASH